MKEIIGLRGWSIGLMAIGVSAVAAMYVPTPAFGAATPSVVVDGVSDDLGTAVPARPFVPVAEPMMVLALEEQSIGDASSFGLQREPSRAQTMLAGMTSLAALREHMGKSHVAAPDKQNTIPVVLQVGSFADRDNAVRLQDSLASEFESVYVTRLQLGARHLFRVRVGSFATVEDLESAEKLLRTKGHKSWRLQAAASAAGREKVLSSR